MSPDVTSSPVLVWVAIIAAGLVLLAGTVPKILGPIGESLDAWQKRRAEAAAAADDVDITERDRRITYLVTENSRLRGELADWAARERRWLIEKRIHDAWDYAAQQALIGHEPPVDLAPQYMTPDPPKPVGGTP